MRERPLFPLLLSAAVALALVGAIIATPASIPVDQSFSDAADLVGPSDARCPGVVCYTNADCDACCESGAGVCRQPGQVSCICF